MQLEIKLFTMVTDDQQAEQTPANDHPVNNLGEYPVLYFRKCEINRFAFSTKKSTQHKINI